MNHRAIALLLAPMSLLCGACRASESSEPQFDVISGAVDSLFTLERSIDLVEPDAYPIGLILDAAIDRDGRVYLVDYSSREVRTYEPDGSGVQVVGGTGQGPGEYTLPTSVAWSSIDGRLAVVDLGNSRIVTFQGAEWDTTVETRLEAALSIRHLRFGPEDQLVAAGLSNAFDLALEPNLALVTAGTDTVRFLPVPESFLGSTFTKSMITGLVDTPPGHILAAITGHPRVYRLDYRGTVMDSVTLPPVIYEAIELPSTVQEEDPGDFTKRVKWIQALRSTTDGRVAVLELYGYESGLDEWLQQIVWLPLDGDEPAVLTDPCDCRLLDVDNDQVVLLRGAAPFTRRVEWRSLRSN